MPGCARIREAGLTLLLAAVLAAPGCGGQGNESRFELSRVDAGWTNGQVRVSSSQRLSLSPEAREALVHGVPLTIELEVLLRNSGTQTRVNNTIRTFEIRYLPLSDHYQLTRDGGLTVRTFPRLRHALAELSRIELTMDTGVLPAGDYELLARIRLDSRKMPPPMRLPVLLSSKWRHDSSWSSWPLQIDPGA